MKLVNKKSLTVLVVLLAVIASIYFYSSQKSKMSIKDKQNEIEYAEITKKDVENKPFLANLPIRTNVYTIIYSSLKNQIVVIFDKSTTSVESLKYQYVEEVVSKLSEAGYTENNIVWEMKQ